MAESVSTSWNSSQFSLADFFYSDTNSPLVPPPDYLTWRRETAWATALYEPVFCDGAGPVNHLKIGADRRRVINMTSYGYLGLVRHPAIVEAAKQALDEFGTGACGSPILSGKSVLHERLEQQLVALTGRDGVLLYTSGYGGALGSSAGLLRKGDTAVIDARAHISLMDGARLGGARIELFEHNDPSSLDARLAATKGQRRLVIVDGMYSMDGDMADLPALLSVAEAHHVGLLVDEAHSILCCGPNGGGVVEHFGVGARVGVQYATCSKGFAGVGGFAAADRDVIEYLRFYSNSYAFSCALPPAVVAGLSAAIEVMARETWRRDRLWENATYFRSQLQSLGVNTGPSESYIVPMVVGEERALLYELGHALRTHGLFVTPVDYPTVPLGQSRLRASVTAAHSRADLDGALQIIEDVFIPPMRARGLLRG